MEEDYRHLRDWLWVGAIVRIFLPKDYSHREAIVRAVKKGLKNERVRKRRPSSHEENELCSVVFESAVV